MISSWSSVVPPKFEMIQKTLIRPGGPIMRKDGPATKRGEHRREGNLQIGVGALPGLAAEVRATLPG